ncbi:acyl carrier protein [Sphingomonas sp. HDW15A]|uniref:acyl carrier protein n=1 Tax=Sphingomonas sp. HDW15A TaxID=2714942 RepID=UPI00140E0A17|nr:acyl carrier protein [Sphingomonas sp. HDW15A]QIK96185.1 acyl carrier protein [Sphingomonas sp. HDW15A]
MSTGLKAMPRDADDEIDARLRALLAETLGLSIVRVAAFGPETALFGALPELDSMAVANLLTGIEERFDLLIEDDDVEAEDFETYGRLLAFVERLGN